MARERRGLVPQRRTPADQLEPAFRLGDIVRLKRPDGPKRMMVVDCLPGTNVTIAYRMNVNGKNIVREWSIHPDLLKRVRDLV